MLDAEQTQDRGQHSARGTSGRTCGMLGNEIRRDQGLDHGKLSQFVVTIPLSVPHIICFFNITLMSLLFRPVVESHLRDERVGDMRQMSKAESESQPRLKATKYIYCNVSE